MDNDNRQLHDVIFSVSKVLQGELFRGEKNIIARATVKMNKEQVDELEKILQLYKANYKDGAGPATFTLEGQFT